VVVSQPSVDAATTGATAAAAERRPDVTVDALAHVIVGKRARRAQQLPRQAQRIGATHHSPALELDRKIYVSSRHTVREYKRKGEKAYVDRY